MPKIQVTNIENIPWAKRLIINFSLSQDCAQPVYGSWEYIVTSCGYRNVCDSEWTIMIPNKQHPLHSNVIKFAGNYTFVWDYGGVFGLDPAEFDAEHSYIVQLAMYDPTCNINDACSFANYETQDGEEPIGTIGTQGDANDTYNNCGVGYILKADSNGCLYCEPIGIEPPINPDDPLAGGEPNPVIVNQTPPGTPFEPAGSAFNPYDTPGNGGGSNPGPTIRINGVDVPTVVNSTPGPRGLSMSDLMPSEDTSLPFGVPNDDYLPDSYSMSLGPLNSNSSIYGPGAGISGEIYGSVFGGKAPSLTFSRDVQSLVPYELNDYISQENAINNKRHSAEQLNISPNNIGAILNSDYTLNKNQNTDTFRKTTRAIDTFSISGATVNVRGKTYISTNVPQQAPLNSYTYSVSNRPSRVNINDSSENRSAIASAQQNVFNTLIPNLDTDINKESLKNISNAILNLTTFKDTQDFTANYRFSLFAQDSAKAGSGVFCEAKLTSINNLPHRYKVYVYAKTNNGLKLLASSFRKERKGNILISKLMRVPSEIGNVTVIAIVVDGTDNVIGLRYKDVTIE